MLDRLKQLAQRAARAVSIESLLGVEGTAAAGYFGAFAGMIKVGDAVNALLSFAYSLLARDLTIVCHAVGFDPFIGFYHQPRFGRPALALDLMPWRARCRSRFRRRDLGHAFIARRVEVERRHVHHVRVEVRHEPAAGAAAEQHLLAVGGE